MADQRVSLRIEEEHLLDEMAWQDSVIARQFDQIDALIAANTALHRKLEHERRQSGMLFWLLVVVAGGVVLWWSR